MIEFVADCCDYCKKVMDEYRVKNIYIMKEKL